jgi:hypothetical protein
MALSGNQCDDIGDFVYAVELHLGKNKSEKQFFRKLYYQILSKDTWVTLCVQGGTKNEIP